MSIKLRYSNGYIPLKCSTFPAGELFIQIEDTEAVRYLYRCVIEVAFESSDDLIYTGLLHDAVLRLNSEVKIALDMKYFPYARQDRSMEDGQSASLVFVCNYLKMLNFEKIFVWDAHSYVLENMFPAGVFHNVSQQRCLKKSLEASGEFYGISRFAFVAPDAGAYKKTCKVAEMSGSEVLTATKTRNSKGVFTQLNFEKSDIKSVDVLYVVDDICDGGATFIELAKAIRKISNVDLCLIVTHGIFSKGFEELERYYNFIGWANPVNQSLPSKGFVHV